MLIKKVALLFLTACVLLAEICLFTSCIQDSIKFDNSISFSPETNHIFEKEKIDKLIEDIKLNDIEFDKFKDDYKVEYLRTTEQCYYTVLFRDDGAKVFVFIDFEFEFLETLVFERIKSKNEFENFLSSDSEICYETVKVFDKSTWDMPVSSVTATIHYVKEGIYYIQYDRKTDLIEKTSFFENSDIESVINTGVPYILPIDKV